jgi:Ca2+-binding EF-hand superfamily protein
MQLRATDAELRDHHAVGATSGSHATLDAGALREFLREKLMSAFVRKGERTSAGFQLREAISRFDGNRDGTMSLAEMRKAMNALGLAVRAGAPRACPSPAN